MAGEDVDQWLRDEMEALVAGSPTIKFVNDVYSMRVLLERLTPTQDQAHTLPRPPSMPLLLDGAPPDEDLVLEWKKEHFGEEEAEEAHAEQKALRDALQAEEASLEAQKRGVDVETYQSQRQAEEQQALQEARLRKEAEARSLKRCKSELTILEPVTRQLLKETEPKSVQELADENQVPRKLAYWNAGHQDQKLELSSKSLQKDDFYLLEYILRFNYPIHTVALKACFLTDDDALGLVEALSSNFVLTSLDMSLTKITDVTTNKLADMFKEYKSLKVLDLRRNNISAKAAARLAQAFPSARALEVLSGLPLRSYLDNPPTSIELTEMDLRLPEAVLLRDTLARTIKMTINKLDNYEITSSLTELDLSTNLLDEGAMDVLASLVEAHSSLTSLNLSQNQGGPHGLAHLANMLSRNTWLTSLKIADNDVTREGRNPDGVSSLSDALKVNRTLTYLDITENDIDEAKEREIQEKVSVNRAVNHTQKSFVEFLDSKYAPDAYDTNDTGGYIINLELSREYLETEKRSRPPPRVRFDEPQPYKPWRDADGGDDWSLLEPEPMRRATRAKLKRARRLLEAHILAHKGFGFSAASALLALHRGLFAEAPSPAPGPAPAPAPSPAPAPAPPEAEVPQSASRIGTAAGDSRSEGNELNTRSVASLGLGPHASVDTFHTVMTDDPE